MIKISYTDPEDGLGLSVEVNDAAVRDLKFGSSYHSASERTIYLSTPSSLSEADTSNFINSLREALSKKFNGVMIEVDNAPAVFSPPVFDIKS